jgi:Mce-associated membrane protein
VKAPARPSSGSRGGKKQSRGKPGRSGKSGKAALARRRRAERSLKRTHRAVAILGLLAVLALAAGGGAWWLHLRDDAVGQARDDAVSAAQAAAPALLSYDYRTFDASVRRAKPYLGGSFAKKYAKTTASLKHYAVKQKAILTARVSATSVVSARSDEVVLLLYVDQYKQNTTITGQKVDQNRVVLTMTPIAGKWKVTKVTAI